GARAPGNIRPPEIPLSAIPVQPGEKLARERFKAVIDAGGDSPLVDESRLELAELCGQRDDVDGAIAALKDAAAGNANPDFADRIKIRLGSLYLAKGDAKSAAAVANEILITQQR